MNVFDWPNSELCQSVIPTAVGFSNLIIEGQVDKLIVHLLIFTFYYICFCKFQNFISTVCLIVLHFLLVSPISLSRLNKLALK